MNLSFAVSLLSGLLLVFRITAFNQFRSKKWESVRFSSKLLMAQGFNPVICGAAGGTAETIACNLLRQAKDVQLDELTIILDQAPFSPFLSSRKEKDSPKLNIIFGELESGKYQTLDSTGRTEKSNANLQKLLDGGVIIAVDDIGDAAVRQEVVDKRNPRKNQALEVLQQVTRIAPPSVASIICGVSLETEKEENESGLAKLIKGERGSSALRKWSDSSRVPYSAIRFGDLVGAVPGLEPIPFKSLPLSEPELDPSYELLSVVCSSVQDTKVASKERCTRDNLANAMTRLYLKQREALQRKQQVPLSAENALLISIPGSIPSERDWESTFQRLLVGNSADGSRNSVVLTMEFGKILKPQNLVNYLVENWFNQALLETATATVSTGARPVRIIRKTFGNDMPGVSIIWEALDPKSLEVKTAGSLDIILEVNGNPPLLKVVRNSNNILPAESPLLDKLQEGVNANAYKKQFCEQLSQSSAR